MTDETKEELQKTMGKLIDEYNEAESSWKSLSREAEKWRKQGLSLVEEMKGEDESTRASLHLYALDSKNEMDKVREEMKLLDNLQKERKDKLLSLNQKAKKLGFSYELPEEWEK